jgi:hypothetical protein
MQTSIEQIAGIRRMMNTLEESVKTYQKYLHREYLLLQGSPRSPEGNPQPRLITNAETESLEEMIREVSRRITGTDDIPAGVWELSDSFIRKHSDTSEDNFGVKGNIDYFRWFFIWIQKTRAYIDFLEGSADATGGGRTIIGKMDSLTQAYNVALSFAGEDRLVARQLADLLRQSGFRVFFDEYEKSQLWGRDLYAHLSEVYKNRARYCVMFLSQSYSRKLWTNHERKAAQARSFRESREYILPLRLDDTEVPGILETTGYIDLRDTKIEDVYEILCQKLNEVKEVP